jgi:hypothetical protein
MKLNSKILIKGSLEYDFTKKSLMVRKSTMNDFEEGINNPSSIWTPIINAYLKWFKKVKKDWIKQNKCYANSDFPKEESVYGVIHYDELEDHKQTVSPFINWKPLPILKPVDSDTIKHG